MLNLYLIISLLVFCLNLFVGYKVWRAHPRRIANQLFFFLVSQYSIWLVFIFLFRNTHDFNQATLFFRLALIAVATLPPTLYLLTLVFPNRKLNLSKTQRTLICCWTLFNIFFSFTPTVFSLTQVSKSPFFPVASWGIIFLIFNALFFLILTGRVFFHRISRARGLEKTRLSYLLTAFIFMLLAGFFFSFLLPTIFQSADFFIFGSWLMSLIMTSIIGYALLKIRFTSLRFTLVRILYYSILFLWIVAAAIFLLNLSFLISAFYYAAAASFLIIWSIAFIYIYQHLEEFLVKKIVNHNLNWRAENKKFVKKISRELNLNQIINETLQFISLMIKNQGNFIYEDFTDDDHFFLTSTFTDEKQPALLYDFCQKKWQTGTFHRPIILEELSLENHREDRPLIELMKKENYAVIFSLVPYSGSQGILVLGDKSNYDPYFIQDLTLLEKTLSQTLPMIDRAVIYQNVKNFNNYLQKKVERATRRLIKVNDKLVAADKIKDEFVSVASHELRTPMTAIKNYLWLVNRNNNDQHFQENKKFIKIALDATDRLINMVNDMLTISRIEGDRFDLNQDKVDLNKIVEQTYLILSPLATNKDLEFKKKLAKKPVFVLGDAAKVAEVVQNIVGNALKFTRQGQVVLSCYQENDQAFISVKDTGPGISPEDFSKLFKKFCRLENSYVKIKETGTGLGLYIARQIMLKHKGDIIAESTFGKGSTFTLTFPLLTQD